MQSLRQGRELTLPYTLVFDPALAEYEVTGRIEADPYDVLDGFGPNARTVRITTTVVRVSFRPGMEPYFSASGSGHQVKKDGSLGRPVRGVSIFPTEIQRDTALDIARNVVRKALDAALDGK